MPFEFSPQCCDALHYLDISFKCANLGECYSHLRPLGVAYWFALPLWLGLPQQSLILVHWALLIVSVALSVEVLGKIVQSGITFTKARSIGSLNTFLTLISLAAHVVFFFPVIFNSLADAPAALFALIAIWLLLLAGLRSAGSPYLVAAAGMSLGLAAWIRVFYLYPLFGVVFAVLALWSLRPVKRIHLLAVLFGLIPVAIQYWSTYDRYGYFSFLTRDQTEQWTDMHLNESTMGYDTLLPMVGHRWSPSCNASLGPFESLREGNVIDAFCLYGSKLYFYFGSYAHETYLDMGGNGVTIPLRQISKEPIGTLIEPGLRTPNAPSANNSIIKNLQIAGGNPGGSVSLFAWADNIRKGDHTFSAWLWSENPHAIVIQIVRLNDGKVLASKPLTLTPVPTRHSVTAKYKALRKQDPTSLIGINIGVEQNVSALQSADVSGSLYVWGSQLERSTLMTEYWRQASKPSRLWSTSLLILHFILLFFTIFTLARSPAVWNVELLLGVLFVSLCFGQSLAIVPEQRFLIIFQVIVWVFGCTGISMWIGSWNANKKVAVT